MLTDSKKQQITEWLNDWLDPQNPERSLSKLSEKSKVNISYLHSVKEGKNLVGQTSIKDEYYLRISEALGKNLNNEHQWNTKNFLMIQRCCSKAQKEGRAILLDSDESGLGKTHALEHYYHNHDRVLYVKCDSAMGAQNLLVAILQQLKIRRIPGGNRAKLMLIKEKISNKDYLTIIDEAELVRPGMYHIIKDIIDINYRTSGLLVSGMGLMDYINYYASKHRKGFPQIRRRLFPNRVKLYPLSNAEITEICRSEGIESKAAIRWFCRNISDFQMLSQYIADAINAYKNRIQKDMPLDDKFLDALFNSWD